MGFRCPVCKKDFGIDKAAFMEHIKNCSNGLAKNIVEVYTAKSETEAAVKIKIIDSKLKWGAK